VPNLSGLFFSSFPSRAPVGFFAALPVLSGRHRFDRLAHWSLRFAPGFTLHVRTKFVKNWYLFVESAPAVLNFVSEVFICGAGGADAVFQAPGGRQVWRGVEVHADGTEVPVADFVSHRDAVDWLDWKSGLKRSP
jgi:hypothetical protein